MNQQQNMLLQLKSICEQEEVIVAAMPLLSQITAKLQDQSRDVSTEVTGHLIG